uniref:Uncharacterized protein n=1 Tax=Avena sativa TaxID=4498 RepID=A0ACD5YZK1_AVESA
MFFVASSAGGITSFRGVSRIKAPRQLPFHPSPNALPTTAPPPPLSSPLPSPRRSHHESILPQALAPSGPKPSRHAKHLLRSLPSPRRRDPRPQRGLRSMLPSKRLSDAAEPEVDDGGAGDAKRPKLGEPESTSNGDRNGTTPPPQQEIDEDLHSRQLAVYGRETMRRLFASDVLVSGLNGLGAEIAKNLALAGVKSVTIHDVKNVEMWDLSGNFFLSEDDVGKNRAVACVAKLQDLNNAVLISALTEELTTEHLSKFQAVVFTDIGLDKAYEFDDYCRSHQPPISFIKSEVCGLFGSVFCDFGPKFTVLDVDGEDPHTGIIASVTNDNPALVSCVDDERLEFQDGDLVVFSEVHGMAELNDGKPRKVKNARPFSFSIEEDTSNLGIYIKGGIVTQVKEPKVLCFKALRDAMRDPGDFLLSDFSKFDRPPAPMCTVHSFPHNIDHCLTWARSEFEGLLEKTPNEVNSFLSNPAQYAAAMRKAGDAQARELLERVSECLDKERCNTFDDCISWARLKFEDYFSNRVKQLTFTFPEDAATSMGAPFWSAPKRFPRALQFSAADPSHLNFIMSASILRAESNGVAIPEWAKNTSKLADVITKIAVPTFEPKKGVNIVTDEKASNLSSASVDDVAVIEDLLAKLQEYAKRLPPGFQMKPIQFEKLSYSTSE